MPIDINRLFGSAFHARSTDAEWRAGVTLWLKSYHQVPAGSLPEDDVELCRLAELGRDIKAWKRIKAKAMHGWQLCADGRLYHETVNEKALQAWRRKGEQRVRTLKARIAAMEKRLAEAKSATDIEHVTAMLTDLQQQLSQALGKPVPQPPTHPVTPPVKEPVTDPVAETKGQGEGQGQGEGEGEGEGEGQGQGQGEGDSSSCSEANASGATAPAGSDLASKLFTEGVDWLQTVTKKPNAHCRSLIGKWRQKLGDNVLLELLAEAQRQNIQGPEAWFTAAIKVREQQGTTGVMPKSADEAMEQFRADPAWRGVAA